MKNTLTLESVISNLKNKYPFDFDETASILLKEDSKLIDAISKSIPITALYFNGDRLYLTIIKDPEHQSLDKFSIIVKTSLDASIAFSKMSDLDKDFAKNHIPPDILVHVEFQ